MKAKRHAKIIELISNNEIETQEELADRLNQVGFSVTQATVSRDIRELKLAKVPGTLKNQKYAVIVSPDSEITNKYTRVLKEGFVSNTIATNLVVIKTVTGMAMAVATALDHMEIPGLVGCIAGDDTIMCVMKDKNIGRTAIAEINHMIKKLKE